MTERQKTAMTALAVFSLIIGMFVGLGLALLHTFVSLEENTKRMQYIALFGIVPPKSAEECREQAPLVQAVLDRMNREVMFSQVYYDQARGQNLVTEADRRAVELAYVRLRVAQSLAQYFKVLDSEGKPSDSDLTVPTSGEKYFVRSRQPSPASDCFLFLLSLIELLLCEH